MRRGIDRDTAAGIKRAIKQALDTEQAQRDSEHKEVVTRLLGNFDTFIKGAGNGSAH